MYTTRGWLEVVCLLLTWVCTCINTSCCSCCSITIPRALICYSVYHWSLILLFNLSMKLLSVSLSFEWYMKWKVVSMTPVNICDTLGKQNWHDWNSQISNVQNIDVAFLFNGDIEEHWVVAEIPNLEISPFSLAGVVSQVRWSLFLTSQKFHNLQ